MPESRKRDKTPYTPPPTRADKSPVKIGSPVWLAPVMVAMFVIGLVWIVAWYIAPDNPIQGPLAGWNIAIGFAFITVGFVLSTKWR